MPMASWDGIYKNTVQAQICRRAPLVLKGISFMVVSQETKPSTACHEAGQGLGLGSVESLDRNLPA
jgi:hypothetical protein